MVTRQAHNLETAGSIPAPAPNNMNRPGDLKSVYTRTQGYSRRGAPCVSAAIFPARE